METRIHKCTFRTQAPGPYLERRCQEAPPVDPELPPDDEPEPETPEPPVREPDGDPVPT